MPSLVHFGRLYDLIKGPIFKNYLKLIIRINRKFPYKKLTFFRGKLYKKFFLFETLGTHGILHTEFGHKKQSFTKPERL